MKSLLFTSLFMLLTCAVLFGQQESTIQQPVSINSSGDRPDTSAMLDVTSSARGFLMPRLSSSDRLAIFMPAQGLLVYDTTLNTICHYRDTTWSCLPPACESLDMAYDCGGPGMGRTIMVDTGAVELVGTSSVTPTLTASSVSASSTVELSQSGMGSVLRAGQFNSIAVAPAAEIAHDGLGESIRASTFNPMNSAATIAADQFGLGHAGHFQTLSPPDTMATIKAEHFTEGDGVHGISNSVDTFGRSGVVGTGQGDAYTAAALHAHDGAIRVSKTISPNTPAEKLILPVTWFPLLDCPDPLGGPGPGGDNHALTSGPIVVPNVYADPARSIILLTTQDPFMGMGPYGLAGLQVHLIGIGLAGPGTFTVQFTVINDSPASCALTGTPSQIALHYLIINL